MEWTTSQGHANVWAAAPFEYAPLWQANRQRDPDAAAAAAMHDQGGAFVDPITGRNTWSAPGGIRPLLMPTALKYGMPCTVSRA